MEKRKLVVLAIDDDKFSVAILRHYASKLQRFDLDIHHTVHLQESLRFLDEHPEINCIFLDYRVHGNMTGLNILQHIRAKGINIPVIVVTGSGNEEIAVAMMKAGASDYLVKANLDQYVIEKSLTDIFSKPEEEIYNRAEVASEELLKDIALRNSLNAVCVLDFSGVIKYVNPSFVRMWGYGKIDDVLGFSIKQLFYDPEIFDGVIQSLENEKSWMGEIASRRVDASIFVVQSLFSKINNEEEDTFNIMASFIDITQIKDNERKREVLYKGIMEVFALRAEEVGNVETSNHIRRIASYVRLMATKLKDAEAFSSYINEKYINDISYASMLHDVGKWRTPNEILLKPDDLTPSEWEVIKEHPKLGVEMLSPLLRDKGDDQYLKLVESVVLCHHERWDGTGYPQGLKGEEIPLSARIVALADMYDALTSVRSYRKALTHEDAYAIMEQEKDKFDPRIWEVFVQYNQEFKQIRENIDFSDDA